jgi:hypothetical protein
LVILATRISAGLLLFRLALTAAAHQISITTTRRPCAFSPCGSSSSSSYWDDGDFTRSMRSVPSVIKWCVCITIRAGRRHLFAHARACSRTLYEGSRYRAHYTAKIKCVGSGMLAKFDPRPNESQQFKLPKSPWARRLNKSSIIGHCNECRFQPSMALQLLRLGRIGF